MISKEKPKLSIPAALGLCQDCIETRHEFVDDDSIIVCYCIHSFTGGLYQIDRGIWRLSGPISEEDFEKLSIMQRSGIRAAEARQKQRKQDTSKSWWN